MTRQTTLRVLLFLALAFPAAGQAGDRDGEIQPPLPDDLEVPPAPALSWEEELATFRLAPGLRVELVAAEPLVNDPIAAEFDENGRLWVVEMTAFMPDVDGRDETAPVCTISVLEDTDGDGRMDERVVFMDQLVLPRSVHPTRGGALVILPGEVLFCRDVDDDGRADERTLVDSFNGGIASPEHALNGFVRTHDNWYRCANGRVKYRFDGEQWIRAATTGGGQWGITKDDLGRVFYNTNSDPLRGDLFPSVYSLRNPAHGSIPGTNTRFAHDFTTWPARITPGVNRGYQGPTLRDDFTLKSVTAVCGPHIYRGDAVADLRGAAIVPEPSGNLVKCYQFRSKGELGLEAVQAFDGRELFTSTDERFRPVNAFGGPDGALYLVDLYRGVIQHRVFVTSFLRAQIIDRGLERPIGLGRIWRVVTDDFERPEPVRMSEWSWPRVIDALSSPNGWTRDTAQRVIVDEWDGDSEALELLAMGARDSGSALGRVHAIWALEGIDELDRELVHELLEDPDPRVLAAAVRVAEPYLAMQASPYVARVHEIAASGADARAAHLALLALGASRQDAGYNAVEALMRSDATTGDRRGAAMSGLRERELDFLERIVASDEWATEKPGRADLLRLLARGVARSGAADKIERIVEIATSRPPTSAWQTSALCRGLLEGRSKGPRGNLRPLSLSHEPAAHARLAELDAALYGDAAAELAAQLADGLVWPGKPGVPEEEAIRPLGEAEQALFERGRVVYANVCVACHQESGRGEPGKAPPLRGSKWVLGSEQRLVRILAQGLTGPIVIDGVTWDMDMPALPAPSDDLAAVVTYIRREWGHGADPISPEFVRGVIEGTRSRSGAWTVPELLDVPE